MQSIKSKIILGLLRHQHLFKLRLKRPPFDASIEGIIRYREKTSKAAKMFGKLPKEAEVVPVTIGERYAEWIKLPTNNEKKAMLYFHGGFYLIGSPQAHRQHVIKFVKLSKINALVFDYRLAPEHPFPAALEDALEAYNYLIYNGFNPKDIVFAGDSAGGGLCLATMLSIKDSGKPLPAAAAVLSPWTDLLLTGASHTINKEKCFSPEGCAENASILYAGENDKRNPYISPLYGELSGLPPLHISAGNNETLRDDSIRFTERAIKEGVDVTLKVEKGMCHCFPAFGNLFKESKIAMEEIGEFLKMHAGL